jgi:hypothetical protein
VPRTVVKGRNHRKPSSAADILYAIGSPEMYRLLVVDRGWSGDRFERWYAETLSACYWADLILGSHLTARPWHPAAYPDHAAAAIAPSAVNVLRSPGVERA